MHVNDHNGEPMTTVMQDPGDRSGDFGSASSPQRQFRWNSDEFASDARREALGNVALTIPALLVVCAMLILPLVWLLTQSFIGENGITLANYRNIFGRPAYLSYLETTFELALTVTLACLVLAIPIAYAVSLVGPRLARLSILLIVLCSLTSILVRTYAWLLLLERRGLINTWLQDLGLVDHPLTLVFNYTGVLVGMVHALLPLMILPIYGALLAVDGNLPKAACSLGASPVRAFWTITFPLALPGVAAGCIMVSVLSLGFFLTPALLGGGQVVVWATAIVSSVENDPVWGAAAAMGILLLVITMTLLAGMKRVLHVNTAIGKKGAH
jgi:ABC-type spermidine/putrescine transport system permease subunit I